MVSGKHRGVESPAPLETVGSKERLCPVLGGVTSAATEDAWLEVIEKMEQVYSQLISHQVELEQKNAELESAYQFISSVQTAMTDLLIVCDEQLRVCQVNRALISLTGLSEESLLGREVVELFCDESRNALRDLLSRAPVAPVYDCELNIKGRYGRVPLSINCARRTDNRERLDGMVLIGRHVGELRRAYDELNRSHAELMLAQQQLVNSEKMASLGRLVAGVAHELNNPISFVYGNTHALAGYGKRLQQFFAALRENPQPEEMARLRESLRIDRLVADLPNLLDGSMEGVERVRDIVSDLRQFSAGQGQETAPFDLVHVVETAIRWVTSEREGVARVSLEAPPSLTLEGHAGHIQQLLMNLLQNALDAVESVEQPSIEVLLELEGEQALCRVRDNGSGIAETDLPHLFEPFFTTKEIGKGTGLGLALSYNFAVEHGGDLQAENHPQGGAIFTLKLPLPEAKR
ncbi:sensor histidine kinase [Aestuariirhabdus litorea]|uniref:histidine kinase n=1 Tax=Aestuariirhabdus litorea TaxID=2528527 RepID=A0A3P3VMK6_9GAMM|nr:ATP-binding protein [Aestuariirhabdus litorea]RRJ83654.1 PAS domain S-box protein [Aestuariirhabdus litorea]RWW96876.1 PAS domain S-box protein [Endozoicomonadaceae bacterium GTF-13]